MHERQPSLQVIFEGLDGSFCRIGSMIVWWNKLPFDLFVVQGVFQVNRALVVQNVGVGLDSSL